MMRQSTQDERSACFGSVVIAALTDNELFVTPSPTLRNGPDKLRPEDLDNRGARVIFASPGMLQSSVSRQLFDGWCTDPSNCVVIAGYAVENTLARQILSAPKEVTDLEGRRQPLNALVDYVSFLAHVDLVQNRSFITKVAPWNIMLVHGQKDKMGCLKDALWSQCKREPEHLQPSIKILENLREVRFVFQRWRSAKVMG